MIQESQLNAAALMSIFQRILKAILAKSDPPGGWKINSIREKTGKKFSSREKVKN